MIGVTFCSAQILDYTSSQIIAVNSGKARIQQGNFKLIHIIELDDYQRFTNNMNFVLDKLITSRHPLYQYLTHELTQLQTLLDGVKGHKTKRSLDFLGSAWK